MRFQSQYRVHFDEADPAGIAFSGHVFSKLHRNYEDFIKEMGLEPKDFFLKSESIYPLRAINCEFFAPLFPFETYPVFIHVVKISQSSFQLEFQIMTGDRIGVRLSSTHVCCDRTSKKKKPLPENIKSGLERFVLD